MDRPVACTLTSAGLERRREVLDAMRATCRRVDDLDDGVRLTFDAGAGTLARLADVIDLERACCQFLHFALEVPPGGAPFTLTLTGPPCTAEFLRAELGVGARA